MLRVLLSLGLTVLFATSCAHHAAVEAGMTDTVGDAAADEPRRIIDMHLHALPLEFFPSHHDRLTGYDRPESDRAVMRETLEALERFGVEKAVISGVPQMVAAYAEVAPDRIIPSLMIPLNITPDGLRVVADSLGRWHEQGDFQVIGEVLTQYAGIAPGDAALEPIFAFAAREGVPIGIHMGPGPPGMVHGMAPDYRLHLGDPLELEEVLARHPDLKLYMMHAGHPRLDNMLAILHAYPQVHADLSVINWVIPRKEFHRYLQALAEAGFTDRLMFGSDQMIWPNAYEAAVRSIETAEFLSEEQKDAIFYRNAARFLGLEERH